MTNVNRYGVGTDFSCNLFSFAFLRNDSLSGSVHIEVADSGVVSASSDTNKSEGEEFQAGIAYSGHFGTASKRRIFVHNYICPISISDTASHGATKTLVLNIEKAQHD